MKSILRWCCVALTVLIAGCSNMGWRSEPVLAVPIQPSFEKQSMLAQLEYILNRKQLTVDERVQLLFERGVIYEGLGLSALAQNDFIKALELRPDIPEIYNFLGIYLAYQGELDSAFQAFDSVLELNPTYEFVLFNRGSALYQAGRYELAQDDLQAFYQNDPSDPFRILWLYLVERELDPRKAKQALQERYIAGSEDKGKWGWEIVEFYLGKINENSLMKRVQANSTDNTSLAEHLSEANFYLGKHYLSLGDKNRAEVRFKLAVANNAYHFIEHRHALLELTKLSQEKDKISESN